MRKKDKRDKAKSFMTGLLSKEAYPYCDDYEIKAHRDTQLKVFTIISELIVQEVLDNRDGFQFPHNMGRLMIIGSKKKKADIVPKYYYTTDGYTYNVKYLMTRRLARKFMRYRKLIPARVFYNSIKKRIAQDQFYHWYRYDNFNLVIHDYSQAVNWEGKK